MIVWQDSWYEPHDGFRMLHIYLPDWYYDSSERLPVMYFFDGHNLFTDTHATYGRSWRFSQFLLRWEKPMIVVGLECSHEGDERLSEYNPYDRRWGQRTVHGIGEKTVQWVEREVKPAIDHRFRTWPHREATGIAGSDLGGLLALYAVCCHNQTFGKAAAISGGLRFCERHLLRDLKTSRVSLDSRVYISWGEHEAGRLYIDQDHFDPYYDSAEARATHLVADELESRGATTMVHYQKGGRHQESDWERQTPTFMEFLWLDRRTSQRV